MRIRFEPSARADFRSGLDYIAADNPEAAERLRQRVAAALERLASFPQSGRIVPEYADQDLREIIVAPYRFFYVVRNDVWIIAV